MKQRIPPDIEMRIDGSFKPVSSRRGLPLPNKLAGAALAIAAIAVGLTLAALLLWLVLWAVVVLVPVAFVAVAIAWATYRYQLWRAGRSHAAGRSFGSLRDLYR